MAQRLTQAQLARELGVSRQAIHKHVDAGTLAVGDDGKIDLDQARAAMQTLHPGSKTVQALAASAAPAPAAAASSANQVVIPAAATQFLADADEHGMSTNYHIARTLREAEEARMARLKREEMEGSLIRLEAVRSVAANTLAATREALLQLPARLSTVLAAEASPGKVHDLLQQEIHQALAQLATLPERVGPDARQEAAAT